MTKKAKRRQIMEAVRYANKRVEYLGPDTFTYKRDGELLKEELKYILKHLDSWQGSYDTQHKRAWRGHVREACNIEHESQMGWESFSKTDLHKIWREVAFCNEHEVMYDENKEEFYCPVCEL